MQPIQSSPESPVLSLADMFARRVEQTPQQLAYQIRTEAGWADILWSEFGQRVNNIAGGLVAIGLSLGDRCAILMSTRIEWISVDFGILTAGGATTTIYRSSTPEECRYILQDSGARVCFVENEMQLEKILAVRDALPDLMAIVLVDGDSTVEGVYTLSALKEMGQAHVPQVLESLSAIQSSDLACLIYTSGTTGEPKGVMLTHGNFLSLTGGIDELAKHYGDEKQLLFLPLAHVFGKICEMTSLYLGVPTAIDGDLDRLVETLGEVQPTFMAAVPRVFEKCFNMVVRKARAAGSRKFKVFQWALRVGTQVSRCRQEGRAIPLRLRLQFAIADRLVFSKVRAVFGGRLVHCISGGAPLAVEMAEFFHACGILILEGYGLTETAAVVTLNEPDAYRFGTVGRPSPAVTLKIAEDGEILVKGPNIMNGYYRKAEKTAEVLQDGWFHTGDIGQVDGDGFVKITDRKKNLIVTSGGKNIAPQKIENLLRSSTDVISQVLLHGDRRNFCVALVTLDEESAEAWGHAQGLEGTSSWVDRPEIEGHIQGLVDGVNATLPRHETIKAFAILKEDFSIERGEMTQSMKLRRSVIEANYRATLDQFYTSAMEQSLG